MIELRPYQSEIIDAIHKAGDNVLTVMPTGTGKTIVFTYYAIKHNMRTLVLNWSEPLIDQCIDAVKLIDPSVSVGRFIGKDRDLDSTITVASVQTLKNINNLMLIDRDFDLIILDEAHHISPSLIKILYAFGMVDLDTCGYENAMFIEPDINPYRKLLGVTATPDRTDDIPLSKVFQERIDAPNLEWFIENEHLSDLKFISIDTGIDMSDVRSYMGDLSETQMAKKLIDSGYINELSRVIQEYLPDKESILLYVPNVDTARLAAKLLNQAGIPSDYVIGAEKERRNEVIDRFKNKNIKVLVNCLVLKEGFDAPNVDAIVLCRPTKSKLLIRQIIGRGTRRCEGKDLCTVVDLVVKRRQQDIISASGVFDDLDLSPAEQQTMTIREKINRQKEYVVGRTSVVSVLDKIAKELALDEEEQKKKRKRENPDEFVYEDMEDNINLLLDTRILRTLGLDAKSFHKEFRTEVDKLNTTKPFDIKDNKPLYDYQVRYLQQETGYTKDDLDLLNPVQAQSFMNIIKRQTKPISDSNRQILENVYKVDPDDVPDRNIDARRLMKQLSKMRIQYGKA